MGFRSIAWLVLFAFALQSFIAQTHIHSLFDSKSASAVVNGLSKGLSPVKSPSQDENSSCPFCQAITHAGVFSTPATPSLNLPLAWVEIVTVPLVSAAIVRSALHPWHSRAPPRH